jgi:hypothetical protein
MPDDVSTVTCSACKEIWDVKRTKTEESKPDVKQNTWMTGIAESHQKAIQEMKLPGWATSCLCPSCKKPIGEMGVRAVTLRLNAKDFGDVVVDGMCSDRKCNSVFSYHYRKACRTIIGFHFLALQDVVYREQEDGAVFDEPIQPVLSQSIPGGANNIADQMRDHSRKGSGDVTEEQ